MKVYNGDEVHELLTVWHMLDRHSVDLLNFPLEKSDKKNDELIVLLIKYFNKNSLEEDVDLHWLRKTELEE